MAKTLKMKRVGRFKRGSIRAALVKDVKGWTEQGRKRTRGTVIASQADSVSVPLKLRPGYPLVRRKGSVDPRTWKTISDVPVIVDFMRKAWLPDDWGQGVKKTQAGNSYTVWMSPEGGTFYHGWEVEKHLGRKLGPRDGWNGNLVSATWERKMLQEGAEGDAAFLKLLSGRERACLVGADAFHFCVVSARRAQSLEGAHDIAMVEVAFRAAGVKPTWYVDEGSADDYRALGLKVVVGGKLTAARNLALTDARRQRKVCVQCSDDISMWEYRDGALAKATTDKAQNDAHFAATRYAITPVAAARFILAKMRGVHESQKPRLGGVYCLSQCQRNWATPDWFRRHHFIIGDFFVDDGSDLLFDGRLALKEDYDFTAQHLQKYGSVMRCEHLTMMVKHYSNDGGAVQTRDKKGLEERRNMAILFKKWPLAIFPHRSRQNEVRFAWPCGGEVEETRATPKAAARAKVPGKATGKNKVKGKVTKKRPAAAKALRG